MPRKPPPVWPKGTRPPNSGRKKGTPNRITIEARQLVSQLINNVNYQAKLRRDLEARKIHPTIESLVWSYHLGRPAQPLDVRGGLALDVNARLEQERAAFAALDIADLEVLAAESQALVNRAFALAKIAKNSEAHPQDIEAETSNPPSNYSEHGQPEHPTLSHALTSRVDERRVDLERSRAARPPTPPPPSRR